MIKQNYFLLIKQSSVSKYGEKMSARDSAAALLKAGIWPLWEFTRNRRLMKAGDEVAIYLAGPGNQEIIAKGRIARIQDWERADAKAYPLMLDGTPVSVLHLNAIEVLAAPVKVTDHLSKLSFINHESKKWGVAFMGGTRRVNETDFRVLTQG